jgi:NAD(P)-dependent dehydrogenase (short-subunit alcohol dehydrogenase family)
MSTATTAALLWTPESIPDQSGRLVVVTGANSGIGYVTARELARRGGHVVLACRSPERGQAALDRLRDEVPTARAEMRRLDLASLDSIRGFVDEWDHKRLDLLVNNAGVAMVPSRERSTVSNRTSVSTISEPSRSPGYSCPTSSPRPTPAWSPSAAKDRWAPRSI